MLINTMLKLVSNHSLASHVIISVNFFSNSPVTLGVTTSLRPPATSKCSVVFGSLLKVADHHAMEIADLGLENADLRALYDQLVAERFSVVFYWSANAV